MEKFLSIKVKEILGNENLKLENMVGVTNKLIIEIKKKNKNISNENMSDLILNTLTKHILDKYCKKSLINDIDDIYNDSDDENNVKSDTLQNFVDNKIELIDDDITLFDCIPPIVTGIVDTYYKRKRLCCL
jgi:hypothetical protein